MLNSLDVKKRFAIALSRSESKVSDMLRRWDKSGKGMITKLEFRMGVRAPKAICGLQLEADIKEIDQLFEEISGTGTAALSITEMAAGLKKLRSLAEDALAEEEILRANAKRLRDAALRTRQVADHTADVEAAVARLDHLKNGGQRVEAQLGLAFAKRHFKLCDLLLKWDANHDGKIDKAEFRTHAHEMGVLAEDDEIDRLFESYDTGGGGSLNMDELRAAVRKMQAAGKTAAEEIDQFERNLTVLKRTAYRNQTALTAASASSTPDPVAPPDTPVQVTQEQSDTDEAMRTARGAGKRSQGIDRQRPALVAKQAGIKSESSKKNSKSRVDSYGSPSGTSNSGAAVTRAGGKPSLALPASGEERGTRNATALMPSPPSTQPLNMSPTAAISLE